MVLALHFRLIEDIVNVVEDADQRIDVRKQSRDSLRSGRDVNKEGVKLLEAIDGLSCKSDDARN